MRCLLTCALSIGLGLAAEAALGAITFVDVVANTTGSDGNTTFNGALVTLFDSTLGETGNVTTDFNNVDNLWRYRSHPEFNGGTAWELFNDTEFTDPLITTLSLPPGVYNLYGLFWGGSGSSFMIDFRVGPTGEFTNFDAGPSSILTAEDGSDFENAVTTRWSPGGFGNLHMAPLGEFSITSPITIYAQGPSTGLTADPRTVYDGVGYELVGPPTDIPGDFDGDDDVDGDDFTIWKANFPKTTGGTLNTGDADGDADVEGADFLVWQANFSPAPGSIAFGATVPEPGSAALAALIGVPLALARRLKRR